MLKLHGSTFMDPYTIVRAGSVKAGDTVVQLLCGPLGHCVFAAADHAGETGVVHAVDVRKRAVDSIHARRELGYKGNIEVHHAHPERVGGVKLDDGVADTVLLVDALSLAANPLGLVKEANRLLKSGGHLVVVDWHPYKEARFGPPVEHRLALASARSTCVVAGLEHQGEFPVGDQHYGFVCKRQ